MVDADHIDCRTAASLQRIPLVNGQTESKSTGATRTLGFQLTAAPLTGMLGVQLQESTSWSKSLAQPWKAQASSQNWLCWGTQYETLDAAREVSASIQ